jgi:hypothetical protein
VNDEELGGMLMDVRMAWFKVLFCICLKRLQKITKKPASGQLIPEEIQALS